ncbi:MAG: respiratory nitrate reductase subunit gamma [Candidatus Dormibacteraeota bacterium]|nr:respiratory nitrate reductase subunit gamma [Candidatus Dormibacteraeota bacterium]
MSVLDLFLYAILPYAAIVLFVAGHIWRYRHDQFGWGSRSTQILEGRWLAWGSNLFHYGALAAIAGHVFGLLIPEGLTRALGIPEPVYHVFSAYPGSAAGIACLAGLVILAVRRAYFTRVRRTTTPADVAVYVLLFVVIALGIGETFFVNTVGPTYDYRPTVGVWFRSLFYLRPAVAVMGAAPLIYQVHAVSAWLLYALWPFSRLVHVWSLPLQYLGRPYILYRRRFAVSRR